MIPKTIHYCWFGRNPLPDDALKCIASWRRHMPEYEIIEWNEDNFDVNICPYTQKAYEEKKYAFVSDYARFWILYNYGGLYFDTDVELIKSLRDIVAKGAYIGIEKSQATKTVNPTGWVGINPGLGIGAEKGNAVYGDILQKYNGMTFDINGGTVVKHTTDVFTKYGFDGKNHIQEVGHITVYPDNYFCPMDSTTGIVRISPDTYSIHHYSCSWMNRNSLRFKFHLLKNRLIKIFGEKSVISVSRFLKLGK